MSGFSRGGDTFAVPPPLTSLLTLLDFSIINVVRAEAKVLNVPLKAPFVIATARLESVGNVVIRIVLVDGSVGWGEAPILPSVTVEDQPTALAKASLACTMLEDSPAISCRHALENVSKLLPGHDFASVRAGLEMAILDALAHSVGMPLWWLFGGQGNTIVTDITIPVCSSKEAGLLALEYKDRGFQTIKTKVGGRELKHDIDMLRAIRHNHPTCSLILDANGGYNASDALEVLRQLHKFELTPVLYEQPVARDDWNGLHQVATEAFDRFGVLVVADESCRSMEDVTRIVKSKLAHVVNIKLCKMGILVALEVVAFAQQAGLGLMIGGMVETRIGMGFAAHIAAGLASFRFIDLDTPLLLAEDPVQGGYSADGPVYRLGNTPGHGGSVLWPQA
ncbi:hypothetical protein M758_9G116700 [Ceratodon purpureus]|nr:hypothetical protein M758_9G116700 [Ceratodon purpureus]